MSDPRTLHDLLLRLRDYADAPAVVSINEGRASSIRFAELVASARKVAMNLARRRLARGATVGLIGPNGLAWIEAFWGIVAAGLVAMPIDLQIGEEELARMLDIGDCQLVIAGSGQRDRLRAARPLCAAIDLDAVAADSMSRSEGSPAAPEPEWEPPRPDEVAILVFTSGTTGVAKPVPLTHANLLSNVRALLAERIIAPVDRVLLPLALHHTYPLTVGMLTALAGGATIILPSGISGPQLVEAMRQGRATVLLGVPRLYTALVANIRATAAARSDISARMFATLLLLSRLIRRHLRISIGGWLFRGLRMQLGVELRLMVCGGAAIPCEVEETLEGLGWQVLTGYGLTETSPILAFNRPGRSRIGAAGQALPGVKLRIANADQEGVGEVQAQGSSVFAGYRNDPVATGAAFTADGWFQTGDVGRLDADGSLFIIARATETIVLPNGKKLYPEPLEAAYADCPVIREIAVMRGANGLVALIVPNAEVVREIGAIRLDGLVRDALEMRARTLPSYLRLTGFALLRAPLPRTQLGKIRRHLLPTLYANARAIEKRTEEIHVTAADSALLENPVAQPVWRWLIRRYPERPIDLETSPQLDLGIDSLGWIDLTLALQHEFGIVLTEARIARIITLRDLLGEVIAAAQSTEGAPAVLEQGKVWLEPLGFPVLVVRAVGEMLLRAVMRCFFRLRVEGRSKLPEPPFLLCPNHVSYLDPFAVGAALPHRQLRHAYWAGWTGVLFNSRLRRFFSRAAQVIPVDPDRAAALSVALGALVLSRGRTLVWFPEGGLSPDGSLQIFLPGVGAVLEQRPVPVVPAYIGGSDEAFPLDKRYPRLRRITVCFGDPIDPADLALDHVGRAGQQRVADAIRAAVAALKPSASQPGAGKDIERDQSRGSGKGA